MAKSLACITGILYSIPPMPLAAADEFSEPYRIMFATPVMSATFTISSLFTSAASSSNFSGILPNIKFAIAVKSATSICESPLASPLLYIGFIPTILNSFHTSAFVYAVMLSEGTYKVHSLCFTYKKVLSEHFGGVTA